MRVLTGYGAMSPEQTGRRRTWNLKTVARTAKARSLQLIRPSVMILDLRGRVPTAIKAQKILNKAKAKYGEVFARPSPLFPQHGFVDSRIVTTAEELQALSKEVLTADPNGEIILMEWMNPQYSGVYDTSNHTLTVGIGHDGVTSGKGPHIRVMVPLSTAHSRVSFCTLEGIPHEEVVIELVWDTEDRARTVQFRRFKSPSNTSSGIYVPFDLQLTQNPIDMTCYSPADCKTYIEAGYTDHRMHVVSSFQSHVACQLLEARLPTIELSRYHKNEHKYLTGKVVYQANTKATLAGDTAQLFAKELKNALLTWPWGLPLRNDPMGKKKPRGGVCSDYVAFASYTAKSAMTEQDWSNEPTRRLYARGFASLFWLSTFACIGEARHFWSCVTLSANLTGTVPIKPWRKLTEEYLIEHSSENKECSPRDLTYMQAGEESVPSRLRSLAVADWMFSVPWNNPSMGGKKWGGISTTSIEFWNACRDFIKHPEDQAFQSYMFGRANHLSSLTHNGGQGPMTKFSSQDTIDVPTLVSVFKPIHEETDRHLPRVRCTNLTKRLLDGEPKGLDLLPNPGSHKVIVDINLSNRYEKMISLTIHFLNCTYRNTAYPGSITTSFRRFNSYEGHAGCVSVNGTATYDDKAETLTLNTCFGEWVVDLKDYSMAPYKMRLFGYSLIEPMESVERNFQYVYETFRPPKGGVHYLPDTKRVDVAAHVNGMWKAYNTDHDAEIMSEGEDE